jgi:hypothetical protein
MVQRLVQLPYLQEGIGVCQAMHLLKSGEIICRKLFNNENISKENSRLHVYFLLDSHKNDNGKLWKVETEFSLETTYSKLS